MRKLFFLFIIVSLISENLFATQLNNRNTYISDPALYYSVNGMNMYQKNFEALMQNSVNSNTPGYKEINVSNIAKGKSFGNVVYYKFYQGTAIQSGGSLDFLIQGPAFFVLSCPWGLGYTRDGRFTIDANGKLVTYGTNLPVLGEQGEIFIGKGKIKINEKGGIYVDNTLMDSFLLIDFKDVSQLKSINGSVFYLNDPNLAPKITEIDTLSSLKQGYYEASNVSITNQVSQLPIVKNIYDANSKTVKIILKSMSSGIQMGSAQ